jgi:hypothetical protein
MACEGHLDLCRFCGGMIERGDAIRQRWTASFFARGYTGPGGESRWVIVDQPTCPECTAEHLRFSEDDLAWEIRPGHHLPDDLN